MSESNEPAYIAIDQLQPGIYVYIDMGWLEHPFALSHFMIKSLDQIATLRQLGLKKLRYDPLKSQAKPLPLPTVPTPAPAEPAAPEALSPLQLAKVARMEQLNKQREAINQCEKTFLNSAKAVKELMKNIFSRPKESIDQADLLIGQMVQSMLVDKDVAVHLMGDKVAGEEVYYHSLNVAVLGMILAKELHIEPEAIRKLGVGALFHDLGKMDIPDKVRLKTDPLTRAEQELMRQHVSLGLDSGRKVGLSSEALLIIAQHHEQADGSGYPKGLKGDQIHPLTRIVTLINAYDNLCNHINPQESMTPHEALSLLYAQRRSQFDEAALAALIRTLGVYPPGTVVRLSNESLGLVMSVNSAKPLKPSVLVYDPQIPKAEAAILDLSNEDITISKCIRPGALPRQVFDYLSPRKRVTYYFDSASTNSKPGAV